MDVLLQMSVYCFDKHGNFVRRIGKVGQGPGEYSRFMQNVSNKRSKTNSFV